MILMTSTCTYYVKVCGSMCGISWLVRCTGLWNIDCNTLKKLLHKVKKLHVCVCEQCDQCDIFPGHSNKQSNMHVTHLLCNWWQNSNILKRGHLSSNPVKCSFFKRHHWQSEDGTKASFQIGDQSIAKYHIYSSANKFQIPIYCHRHNC